MFALSLRTSNCIICRQSMQGLQVGEGWWGGHVFAKQSGDKFDDEILILAGIHAKCESKLNNTDLHGNPIWFDDIEGRLGYWEPDMGIEIDNSYSIS